MNTTSWIYVVVWMRRNLVNKNIFGALKRSAFPVQRCCGAARAGQATAVVLATGSIRERRARESFHHFPGKRVSPSSPLPTLFLFLRSGFSGGTRGSPGLTPAPLCPGHRFASRTESFYFYISANISI